MTADHLTPTVTDRGFNHLPAIAATWAGLPAGEVRVYESSAASGPHIWLAAVEQMPSARPVRTEAVVHLTLEDAGKLRDQLTWLIDHHYQGDDPQ